jgi:hypothetical protein
VGKGWDAAFHPVLQIRIRDPVIFLIPGSGDPGCKKSASGMNIFDHISQNLLTFFGLKYNALSIQCCGSGIQEERERRRMSVDKGRFPSRSLRDLLIKETTFTGGWCRRGGA